MDAYTQYPTMLRPDRTEKLTLPCGETFEVPKSMPIFHPWQGAPPEDTYHGKAVLDFQGQPAFAELVILKSFQEQGWDGVWIDTYRRKFRTGYWGTEPLPRLPGGAPPGVVDLFGTWSGAWDVCCWHGEQVVFAESKRSAKDRIRPSQLKFLEGALRHGISVDSFLLVEWDIQSPEAHR